MYFSENLRFRDTEISCQWSYQYNRKINRNCISENINNEIHENVCSLRFDKSTISIWKYCSEGWSIQKWGQYLAQVAHQYIYSCIYQYRGGLSMAFCIFIRCKMCIIKLSFINKIGVEWVGVSKLFRPLEYHFPELEFYKVWWYHKVDKAGWPTNLSSDLP